MPNEQGTLGTVSLLVAGGNEIARKGLCALFRQQPGWEVAAEACDGREAVETARQINPDVAIIDIDMPWLNGLEATRQIAKRALRTKVLLLASRDTDQILPHALEAGAYGCLTKSNTVDDLLSAVEALRDGRSFFTAAVSRKGLDECLASLKRMQAGKKDLRQLTTRQREILQLLAEGNSNKQVGVALNISVKTADKHRANIMQKIDCHSTAELVRYAIRYHIIEA
jgi:DNA-binding NarL/FixJ family response regulator